MEFIFTKISILEEYIYKKMSSSRIVARSSSTKAVLTYLNDHLSLFEVEPEKSVFHNDSSTEPEFNCLICVESCTEIATCMYSNCKHVVMCNECRKSMPEDKLLKCIYYHQHL